MIINLDQQLQISLKDLQKELYLDQIIFELTPDNQIDKKILKTNNYIPYLCKFPTIKTTIKLTQTSCFQPVYETVAVGGTFDHFHLGHQILLLYTALSASKKIYIGVTGSALLIKKKSKEVLEPWYLRMGHVEAFIKSIKPELQIILFQLNDPFGVTIEIQSIDAVVISQETLAGGHKINELRQKMSMKALQLVICPTISPDNVVEHKLSSSHIREYLLLKNSLSVQLYSQYKSSFDNLMKRMQIKNVDKIEDWWARLFLLYSQTWRFYHTNNHIVRLLQQWNGIEFEKRRDLDVRSINIIELAIFFHDAIYRPDSKSNEEQSAELFRQFAQDVGVGDAGLVEEVQKLILQTKRHVPTNALSQIIYDLDMGILDSEHKYYKQYARSIKKEYFPLVGQQYPIKRSDVLRKWKVQKHFFSFEPKNMQSNLDWEIFCLQNNDL